jgi:hypothetical protein
MSVVEYPAACFRTPRRQLSTRLAFSYGLNRYAPRIDTILPSVPNRSFSLHYRPVGLANGAKSGPVKTPCPGNYVDAGSAMGVLLQYGVNSPVLHHTSDAPRGGAWSTTTPTPP